MKKRKLASFALCAMLFALWLPVEAQQPNKIPRIGYLSISSSSASAHRIEAFRQGLRDVGYVEGKNIVIEWRFAEGSADRLPGPDLAAELVRLKVDVIVTSGSGATRPAKEATMTIPIVMTQDNDPVGNGFVASLARPGGNVTGLSSLSHELSAKRLELLKETVAKLTRVAILGSVAIPGNAQSVQESERAATAHGVQSQYLEINEPKDVDGASRALRKTRSDAALVLNGPTNVQRLIFEFAAKHRLPAIYYSSNSVVTGGLMSYGSHLPDLDRRAAIYVDKILKGAKPAELPVEQPTKFEFIINLKTAKQIGLTVPPNVLARADKVIR
jgi:putative tryptophan/tyrosine transport system substrate-binding protein